VRGGGEEAAGAAADVAEGRTSAPRVGQAQRRPAQGGIALTRWALPADAQTHARQVMADALRHTDETHDVDLGMGVILAAIFVPVAVIHVAAVLS
jgi:hypothetical protein